MLRALFDICTSQVSEYPSIKKVDDTGMSTSMRYPCYTGCKFPRLEFGVFLVEEADLRRSQAALLIWKVKKNGEVGDESKI